MADKTIEEKLNGANAALAAKARELTELQTALSAKGELVAALAGEVSLANDDAADNYFAPPLEPFPPIEEDAPARYVTVRDHARR